ncbi:MAG TPA: alpha-hydroxy acid oxidase [Acidimicrobiales bacterium]|nr:alpha-hydroxy acid oxidase [Acidimicrobiales bacterium]
MAHPIRNVVDARTRARRILPRVVFDYIDGGADDEVTMAENVEAFRRLTFRPRMGLDIGEPELRASVLGTEVSMPLLLSPCGLVRLMHPDGAAGAGRAANSRGTIWTLSTVAGSSMEEVADVGGHRWFQLYAGHGRSEATELMQRAEESGYEALVVTIDTPALGNRERDTRNGVTSPLRLDARTAIALGPQVLARPRWALRMMSDGVSLLGRPRRSSAGTQPGGGMAAAGAVAMLASPFTWDDVGWIRTMWRNPLLVKGVLTGDDAVRAADAGADAVIVSNHGGRQLDGAPATATVLAEVVDAAGDRLEVLVDGGIRRGGDVVKALAMGARAAMIGRPYLYALSVGGQRGVEGILDVMRIEMSRTMRLLGCASVSELDRSYLESPKGADLFPKRI